MPVAVCVPNAQVFDAGTGALKRTLYSRTYGHSEWVTDVAFLPDGRLLSSGMDNKLCLWERAGVRCTDLAGHR